MHWYHLCRQLVAIIPPPTDGRQRVRITGVEYDVGHGESGEGVVGLGHEGYGDSAISQLSIDDALCSIPHGYLAV